MKSKKGRRESECVLCVCERERERQREREGDCFEANPILKIRLLQMLKTGGKEMA